MLTFSSHAVIYNVIRVYGICFLLCMCSSLILIPVRVHSCLKKCYYRLLVQRKPNHSLSDHIALNHALKRFGNLRLFTLLNAIPVTNDTYREVRRHCVISELTRAA